MPARYDGFTALGDRYWAMDGVNQQDSTMTILILGQNALWYYQPWQFKTFEQILLHLPQADNYQETFHGKGRVIELSQIQSLVLCDSDGTLKIQHRRGKLLLPTPAFSVYSELFDALHAQINPNQPIQTCRVSLRSIGRGPWLVLTLSISLTLMLVMITKLAGKGPMNPNNLQGNPKAKWFIMGIFWVARQAGFYGSLLLGIVAVTASIWWIRHAARQRPVQHVIEFP